jgi:PAS domain S-box-containing protein
MTRKPRHRASDSPGDDAWPASLGSADRRTRWIAAAWGIGAVATMALAAGLALAPPHTLLRALAVVEVERGLADAAVVEALSQPGSGVLRGADPLPTGILDAWLVDTRSMTALGRAGPIALPQDVLSLLTSLNRGSVSIGDRKSVAWADLPGRPGSRIAFLVDEEQLRTRAARATRELALLAFGAAGLLLASGAAMARSRQQSRMRRQALAPPTSPEAIRNCETMQTLHAAAIGSGEALIVFDRKGIVLMANAQVLDVLDVSRDRLQGSPALSLLHRDSQAPYRAGLEEFMRAGAHRLDGQRFERRIKLASGKRVTLQVGFKIVHYARVPYCCIFAHDVSAEKQHKRTLQTALQEATRANEVKSRFLANVSHEIRTPLNGITGMTDLLGRSGLDAHQQDLLQTLRASTRQLRGLLTNVLDLCRIEADKMHLESVLFDADEWLGRCVRSFEGAAHKRGLALSYTSDLPHPILRGDPYRLVQILTNLLDNAVKFTSSGRIDVLVRSRMLRAPEGACALHVEVRDTGCGIEESVQRRLFAAYTQADDSTTRRYGGSGLGLALCRQLCHAMGGEIGVKSRPGVGSSFNFKIVAALGDGTPTFADTQPPDELDTATLKGARVLVADDNVVNQKLLRLWLEREGMTVESAANGEEAILLACERRFAVLLMDVSMPVMDGKDATRTIRSLALRGNAHRRLLASVPIIGVSALTSLKDRDDCLEAGMNAYVTKPLKRDVLLGAIVHAMKATPAGESPGARHAG